MKNRLWASVVVILLCLVSGAAVHQSRHVTLVGDSLFGCAQDAIVAAINNNNGKSWAHTEYILGGTTASNNPINHVIETKGAVEAFGHADVVAFSFGTNDMMGVAQEKITMDSAIQAMQALMNQAVVAGTVCIVMLESSHRFRGHFPQGDRFETHMDAWFDHWNGKAGNNEYLGIPYRLLIADISDEIAADIDAYIGDLIHFNKAGIELAVKVLVEQINLCPLGKDNGLNSTPPKA